MTEERKAYKDYFDRAAAKRLASQIGSAKRGFDSHRFIGLCSKRLESLEFHDRVKQFAHAMRETLPDSVPQALRVLKRSLPEALPDCEAVTDGWLQWPVGQFVAENGLQYFDESFALMLELTQRFTAEFAIRPFVEHRSEETFQQLEKWVDHKSPHVRRLCSEGVRTRLPWGKKLHSLIERPDPIFPILESLKDDPELYVRRSVANNLNDITKDHPARVVNLCNRWSQDASAERQWIVRHALRSLIKDGDRDALVAVGFKPIEQIEGSISVRPKSARIGGSVELQCSLANRSNHSQNLMVDYVVHYVRQKGASSGKVFKWKTVTLAPGESVDAVKKQSFRETTVRALYPGKHRIELQINGDRVAETAIRLMKA